MSNACGYPIQRPAITVPAPGNASWLMAAQTQARLGLSGDRGPPIEDFFVSIRRRKAGQRESEEDADATDERSRDINESTQEQQPRDIPPSGGDNLAAEFHRVPELKLLIDDQRQRKKPGHKEINSRHDAKCKAN